MGLGAGERRLRRPRRHRRTPEQGAQRTHPPGGGQIGPGRLGHHRGVSPALPGDPAAEGPALPACGAGAASQGGDRPLDDIKAGIKLMDLSEEDLDRGMEIITRTKKYMSSEERKMLIKMESILDLVKGIKKLNDVDILEKEDESEFFRNMDEEDKKNMMIKEILEVFPEKRKESVEKAIDMKKKIDLFAELFLPEDGEGGFSLSSLADISNLGSSNNIKLLGSLLRGDNLESDEDNDEIEEYDEEYNEDDYQYGEYYEEYENGYNKNRYD